MRGRGVQFPIAFHIIPHRTRTFEKFPYHIFFCKYCIEGGDIYADTGSKC